MTETDENIRSQDDSYENEGGTVTITLKEYDNYIQEKINKDK